MAYTINAATIGEAHGKLVGLILQSGNHLDTEDEEATIELPEPLVVHIEKPLEQPTIFPANKFGPRAMVEYVKKVMEITPRKNDGKDASYTYGNRLRDYPCQTGELAGFEGHPISVTCWKGDGRGDGIDQFPALVEKLRSSPNTRRAIMHTWCVPLDMRDPEPPCVQTIQVFVRGGWVNMVVYIRSNDMLSAWGENAYAFAAMLSAIAARLGLQMGWLETISASAHIYYKRDATELEEFRRSIGV